MASEKKPIKGVIFDIGGVLQMGEPKKKRKSQKHYSKGIHESIAKRAEVSLDQYFDAIDQYYALSMSGKINEKELLDKISANLGLGKKELKRMYFEEYSSHFKRNMPLIKKIMELRKRGYSTAILSDQWHLSKKAHFPKSWEKYFDVVIFSCDVGMRKPNKKIYKMVLNKMRLKPSQTIFIDNQTWNILPAKFLGIKTILFKNNEQLFKNKLWKSLFAD